MTLWEQFNPDRTLADALHEHGVIVEGDIAEKTLYQCVKAKLTRKELKFFVMAESGVETETLARILVLDASQCAPIRTNILKKLRTLRLNPVEKCI